MTVEESIWSDILVPYLKTDALLFSKFKLNRFFESKFPLIASLRSTWTTPYWNLQERFIISNDIPFFRNTDTNGRKSQSLAWNWTGIHTQSNESFVFFIMSQGYTILSILKRVKIDTARTQKLIFDYIFLPNSHN